MCIQMPFWINTSSYFIQDWWFKTLYLKKRVNVPDPIQVSNTSHHRHPISQKGKDVSNCHKSSLEGYVQLWFPSPTQIRQTSFSLSPRVWVGDLLLCNLAWAQLPEDSRNATSFKRIGCEVGASHPMNLQIGGLASDKWKIEWTVSPRMEIWRWPVATVTVGKILPGPDHSLFTIQTTTNNKQILCRNSDKNTDTEQKKKHTTK